MPRSTATGRFAHDGANLAEKDNSDGESDRDSALGPIADQGPSIQLFPPSVIAPFIALSQTGLAMGASSASGRDSGDRPESSLPSESSKTTALPVLPAPPPSSSALPSLPAPPPSSSSAPPFQTSSSFRSNFRSGSATAASEHLPPPSIIHSTSAQSLTGSISSGGISLKGKRKQSAIPDLDDHGSLKRHGPRTSSGLKAPPAESAILHGFQGSMNHFSDVVHLNNESQPHTILKDATSKLNGAWGTADKFTDGQKIILLKLFRQDQNIASLYASTENSRVRRGYALLELEPYQNEIDAFDREDQEDDDSMYV